MNTHLNKSYQTLCVTQSEVTAVQSAPDYQNPNVFPASCQPPDLSSVLDSPNHKTYCAKVQVPLRGDGNRVALVDESDWKLVKPLNWRAWLNHNALYAVSGTGVLMHRLILGIHGMGRKIECDHIDRDGLNNTRANLRIVTRSVNLQNRSKFSGDSKYVGVKRSANGQRWLARIYHNKKPILLGTHDTEEQAAREYDKMAMALFGPLARLNFPHRQEQAAA